MIHSIILNLIGSILPAATALVSIPILIKNLGLENFGLFSLGVLFVGYLGILDLGLSRSVVREVARRESFHEKSLCATYSIVIGCLISVLIVAISASVTLLFQFLYSPFNEKSNLIYISILTIPPTILTVIFKSLFEGVHNFLFSNIIKLPIGIATYGIPAVVSIYSSNIFDIFLSIAISRTVVFFISYYLIVKRFDIHILLIRKDILRIEFQTMVRFGRWVAISNLLSPLLVYLDRMIIGFLSGPVAVGLYSVPHQVITRALILPQALTSVLFPKFVSKNNNFINLKKNSYILTLVIMGALCFIGAFFSYDLLDFYVGPNVAKDTHLPLRIMIVGLFFNSAAQIPFTILQAAGESRKTAVIHLLEIVPYMIMLFVFTKMWGVLGAAISWTLRVVFDFIILQIISSGSSDTISHLS